MEGAEEPSALIPEGAAMIKQLAACNTVARNRALRLILSWLPVQSQVSDSVMKKVWKGLFYCIWHADKAPVQSDLIDRLTSLVLSLPLQLSLQYLSVFVLTIRREWSGIDALRLDKFYLLIRRFIRSIFVLLRNNSWDSEILRVLMGVLEEKSFLADDKLQGNGVNYHIASVYLDELKAFLPVKPETADILFKPFMAVLCSSLDKILVAKVKSNVFDVLLRMGKEFLAKKIQDDVWEGGCVDEMVLFGTIALTMGFSGKFYDLGSSPLCFQGNRKVSLGLHQEFLRLENDLELSGIEISIRKVKGEDEDEVPLLIPIVNSETQMDFHSEAGEVSLQNGSVSNDNSSKKKKKVRKGSNGIKKKSKTNKDELSENGDAINVNGFSSTNGLSSSEGIMNFSDSVISNLQKQFEKVAADVGLDTDGTSSFDSPKITMRGSISNKRKRVKSLDGPKNSNLSSQEDTAAKSVDKSAKKVRFSMKNNLVWKPHSPLPPQSLRIPPSVTPRGSALKQGVPPGPVREMPPAGKRVKRKKKIQKGLKLGKIKSFSN